MKAAENNMGNKNNSLSREKNFVKNIIVLAFGTFLPKFASFVTLPIYTAYLTKSEYGTFDLISIFCSLLLPVATLQIQSAAFRFLLEVKNDERKKKSIITTLYCFVIPVSLAVLIAVFLVLKLPLLLRWLIVLYYLGDILVMVTRQVARGLSMNQKYSASAVINSFLNMGLVVVFMVVFHFRLYGLMISFNISVFTSLIYLVFSIRIWKYIDISTINRSLFKEMIQYAWPMVPNSMSLWVMRVSDRFLISIFLGIEAHAVYAVANKIPTLLQLAQNTFSMAWSESASLTVNDQDADEYYSRMFRNIYRVLAGFAAMLIAVLPALFFILIRGDYEDAYVHIPILLIGMFYSSVAIYLGGLYVAKKQTKSIGVTTIVAAAINFIINVLFIRKIGIYAASLSTTISYLILMVYRMIDVKRIQKICFSYSEIIFTNLVMIVMCLICFRRNIVSYLVNFVLGTVFCLILNRDLIKSSINMLRKKFSH